MADIIKENEDFKSFVDSLLALILWIGNREEEFKKVDPCKIPKYICTRWNTLCEVLEFVLNNKKKIENLIDHQIKYENNVHTTNKTKAEKN